MNRLKLIFNQKTLPFLASILLTSAVTAAPTPATVQPKAAPAAVATPATTPPTLDEAQISREYFLKAAFLRYVVKYVEWPAASLPELSYNVCILGDSPSFKGLNSINGKVVNDKSIVVQPIQSIEKAKGNCQILLVSPPFSKNTKDVVEKLKGAPILTFGDFDNFAKDGGDMNFFIMNNHMAIMINPPAVYQKGMKISDKMLKLVSVVPELGPEDMN